MTLPTFRPLFRPAFVLVFALAALPFVGSSATALSSGSCGGYCDWQCAEVEERAITCAQGSGGTCGIGSVCHDADFGGPCGLGSTYVECLGHE